MKSSNMCCGNSRNVSKSLMGHGFRVGALLIVGEEDLLLGSGDEDDEGMFFDDENMSIGVF